MPLHIPVYWQLYSFVELNLDCCALCSVAQRPLAILVRRQERPALKLYLVAFLRPLGVHLRARQDRPEGCLQEQVLPAFCGLNPLGIARYL